MKYFFVIIFRWSVVAPLSASLFDSECQIKPVKAIKTEPVKKCQRALKFFSTSESATQKNLFNTKPCQKELSKLHKQVYMLLNIKLFISLYLNKLYYLYTYTITHIL